MIFRATDNETGIIIDVFLAVVLKNKKTLLLYYNGILHVHVHCTCNALL